MRFWNWLMTSVIKSRLPLGLKVIAFNLLKEERN